MLSAEQRERYARQIMLPQWGNAGQEKLAASTVCIAGAGGLGSPVALYLAAAGVGHLRLCDHDVVARSNLNRQILHTEARIGMLKVESARTMLQEVNPTIDIKVFPEKMTQATVASVVGLSDIVVDCLDNLPTRRLLNRYAVERHIPLVYAGVRGMEGMVSVLHPPATPCFECIFPHDSPSETQPVLGATPGLIGSIQAMETLKYLVGIGELLHGKLLLVDGMTMTFHTIQVSANPACPVCSIQESATPSP